jgi:hypothetical protein
MKGNLKIAKEFENAIGRLWDGDSNFVLDNNDPHIYSCDAIDYSDALDYVDCVAPDIPENRRAFGKYSEGCYIRGWEQGGYKQVSRSVRMKIQMQRALWLTMLAELAEQGEEFPNPWEK